LQLQPFFSATRFLHAPDYWMRQGEKSEKNKGIPQHSNRSRSRILLMIIDHHFVVLFTHTDFDVVAATPSNTHRQLSKQIDYCR